MKENIHPPISTATISCVCGNKIETYSTQGKDFNIEICSACHPLFTGKQRLVDSAGRIERFHRKYASHAAKAKDAKTASDKPAGQ